MRLPQTAEHRTILFPIADPVSDYPADDLHIVEQEAIVMKLRTFIISVIMILTVTVNTLPMRTAAEEPEKTCCTALIEAQTGMCLAGTEPEKIVPIGTQTKLMTVYLAAEMIAAGRLGFEETVTVSPSAEGKEGATVWLRAGEKMTVHDLLKAVIIGNANDACTALACRISGSEQQFVMEMNAAAFTLGMRHTRFADCTGLSADDLSTAHELGILCRGLLQYDFLIPMMTTWRDFLRGGETELVSENHLTKSYEGMRGMKAGHGEASGYTLTLAAERGQLCMIAVVLGSDDDDLRFETAKSLLHEGLTGYYVTTPDYSAEFMQPMKVRHGTAEAVLAETGELLSVALRKGGQISSVTVLPHWLDAPVKKNAVIGAAAFYCDDTLICEAELRASETVPRRRFPDTLRMLLSALFR